MRGACFAVLVKELKLTGYEKVSRNNIQFIFNKIRLGILQREKWQLVVCNINEGVLKYAHNGWQEIIVIKVFEESKGHTHVNASSITNFSATRFKKDGSHYEKMEKIEAVLTDNTSFIV